MQLLLSGELTSSLFFYVALSIPLCREDNSADANFDHQNASARLGQDLFAVPVDNTHILSNEDCNMSNIVAIEYCYQTQEGYLGSRQNIFALLFLSVADSAFTVDRAIPVTTIPQANTTCSRAENGSFVCCAIEAVDPFMISSNDTAVGVRTTQMRNRLLRSTAAGTRQEEVHDYEDTTVGAQLPFSSREPMEGALWLRLISGKMNLTGENINFSFCSKNSKTPSPKGSLF